MKIDHQLIFTLVFLSVLALANYYIYRRLFCQLPVMLRKLGLVLISSIMLGELLYVINLIADFIPDALFIYLALSSFIGITFILLVVTLVYDVILSVFKRLSLGKQQSQTIKRLFDTTVLVTAAFYIVLGFLQGSSYPKVNEVIVRIKDFPIDNYTIAQLTDLHIGPTVKGDFLSNIVQRTNQLNPDIVVITGDLVDMPADKFNDELMPLKNLMAPTYFVTGNHEYYHGVESIIEKIQALGINTLTNQAVRLGKDENSFNLVGINDLTGDSFEIEAPDIEAAYRHIDPSKPTIVLSHQPKSLSLLDTKPWDLMLSGHTHGGQIFPFGLLVRLAQPYISGLHEHKPGQQLFVSRGTGYWGPPLRFLAPSEISKIQITPILEDTHLIPDK